MEFKWFCSQTMWQSWQLLFLRCFICAKTKNLATKNFVLICWKHYLIVSWHLVKSKNFHVAGSMALFSLWLSHLPKTDACTRIFYEIYRNNDLVVGLMSIWWKWYCHAMFDDTYNIVCGLKRASDNILVHKTYDRKMFNKYSDSLVLVKDINLHGMGLVLCKQNLIDFK